MAGFCGSCGTPRADGANFCMNCGEKFAPQVRMCPTCGQQWPEEGAATPPAGAGLQVAAAAPVVASVPPPPAFVAVRGAYSSPHGNLYYDGTSWFRALELPGPMWLPDASQPLPSFEPQNAGLTLMYAESGGSAPTPAGLPRGPQLGPDYMPDRDCGNCGFELASSGGPCQHCGTTNTGSVFRPGA